MVAEAVDRRRGVGTEAVLLMMNYGYTQLNLRRFVAKISDANEPSIAMFKRLGFVASSHSDFFKETTFELYISMERAAWLMQETQHCSQFTTELCHS